MASLRAMVNTHLEMVSMKDNGEEANIMEGVFSCFLMDPLTMAHLWTESPMAKAKKNPLMGLSPGVFGIKADLLQNSQ